MGFAAEGVTVIWERSFLLAKKCAHPAGGFGVIENAAPYYTKTVPPLNDDTTPLKDETFLP